MVRFINLLGGTSIVNPAINKSVKPHLCVIYPSPILNTLVLWAGYLYMPDAYATHVSFYFAYNHFCVQKQFISITNSGLNVPLKMKIINITRIFYVNKLILRHWTKYSDANIFKSELSLALLEINEFHCIVVSRVVDIKVVIISAVDTVEVCFSVMCSMKMSCTIKVVRSSFSFLSTVILSQRGYIISIPQYTDTGDLHFTPSLP